MLKRIARNRLRRWGARYRYDVRSMEWLLGVAPRAFFKVAKIMQAASHREAAPVNAYFAAKLVGALHEDCGPCTQLVVDMALEQGMAGAQLEAVLRRDIGAMQDDTAIGFRFAEAALARTEAQTQTRDAVRIAWGDKALADLALGLQIGRVFPMLKTALGHASACQRVQVGGAPVDVVKQAA